MGNVKNRQNSENLCKFEDFKLKIDDEEFETKLTEVLENCNKVELIQIAKFFAIKP